jgi:hypothetical protein
MIFVHDKGRMANNMLQYGHVYAWGREHGRQTMSMRFAYKYPWFRICHTPHHNFPTYVFAKYAAKWGLIPSVHFDEEGADYSREEQMMHDSKMLMVQGWYARWYDLFLKYKPEILDLFAFDEAVQIIVLGDGEAHVEHGVLPPLFLQSLHCEPLEQVFPAFEVAFEGGDEEGLAEPARAAQEVDAAGADHIVDQCSLVHVIVSIPANAGEVLLTNGETLESVHSPIITRTGRKVECRSV